MAKINPKRPFTTSKIDSDFKKEIKDLAKMRYFQNLEKKEPSMPEMTRLIRRTNSWKNVVFELKTKPRRENI